MTPQEKTQQAKRAIDRLIDEVERVIIGKRDVLERVVLTLLTDGHVLMEDVPGLAKTLTIRTFADALGLSFRRVQFTPDLLPADVTGSFFFDMETNRFELRKGPIFTNILLADEINRAPPKTQSALLEAMQERQTTLEGETHKLPRPFFVFATQNPVEIEGTYPLPEAQLDRFLVQTDVGYPDRHDEIEILRRREQRGHDEATVDRILDEKRLRALQRLTETVRLDADLKAYIVDIVQATREDERLDIGASPRGSLALYKLAKAAALVDGRDYAIPQDIKRVAQPALAHRFVLSHDAQARGLDARTVLQETLQRVPAPDAAREEPPAAREPHTFSTDGPEEG